jgi:hypothetical protein
MAHLIQCKSHLYFISISNCVKLQHQMLWSLCPVPRFAVSLIRLLEVSPLRMPSSHMYTVS